MHDPNYVPDTATHLDDVDHTPLTFGKYKGITPAEVAVGDPEYLVWAYRNVTTRPVCSEVLYRSCLMDEPAPQASDYYNG